MANDGAKARRDYIDAKAGRYRGGPEFPMAMKSALARYLLWYAEATTEGRSVIFDSEIAFDLGDALREVARGRPHPLLTPEAQTGAPSASFATEDAQRDAVRYILWSLARIIPDRAPYITVCREYKVARETVRGWMRALKPGLSIPESPGEDEASTVIASMQYAAHHYANLPGARTDEAIRRRHSNRGG